MLAITPVVAASVVWGAPAAAVAMGPTGSVTSVKAV